MKQFIVLITTIVLGIAIAVMIMGFKTPAKNMADGVTKGMENIVSEYATGSAIQVQKASN